MTDFDTRILDMLARRVLADPNDDVLRLAYADALDDVQADPARARLIRCQVERAGRVARREKHWDLDRIRCRAIDCPVCILSREAESLLERDGITPAGPVRNWIAWTRGMFQNKLGEGVPACLLTADGPVDEHFMPEAYAGVRFSRGWPGEVACTTRQWLDMADSITSRAPVRTVWLRRSMPDETTCRTHWLPRAGRFGMTLRVELAGWHGHRDISFFDTTPDTNILRETALAVSSMLQDFWPKIDFRRCTGGR